MPESYRFSLPIQPSLPIRGSNERFPVNRIFCVGRNYQAHALEMGDSIDKSTAEPFYFIKDRNAIHLADAPLPYPPGTQDFQYEMELVIALGDSGHQLDERAAEQLIFGYACGLDMTRRDLQKRGKDQRRPWDLGKNFEHAAVIGEVVPVTITGKLAEGAITLSVNGALKQSGDLNQLIWNPAEVIAHLSHYYHLQPGDLIYTGTPEGVGPVMPGDLITGEIEGLYSIGVQVV